MTGAWEAMGFVAVLFAVMPPVAGAEKAAGNEGASSAEEAEETSVLDALRLDYETGMLAILQNDNRYGEEGTSYGASDVNQRDNLAVTQRIGAEVAIGRHTAILLYAPLEITTRAVLPDELRFRRELFEAATPVEHRYLFDGYRASYLFRLLDGETLRVQVGASAQIRNANVSLTALDGEQYANQSDIGFVPAAKVRLRYQSEAGVYALFDADGLSTFGLVGDTRGGLYDAALSLGIPVANSLDGVLRVRGYGGGAEVPDQAIENWAHFLSFTVAARADLDALL